MRYLYVPVSRHEAAGDGFLNNVLQGWQPKTSTSPDKQYVSRFLNQGLGDVGDNDRLYIVGHGALSGTSLQTYGPRELYKLIKAEKLPKTHIRISLFSCYSGVATLGQGQCFAEAFAQEIKDRYKRAVVDGYLGAVNFSRDLVNPGLVPRGKQIARAFWLNGGNFEALGYEPAAGNYVQFLVNNGQVKRGSGEHWVLEKYTHTQPADSFSPSRDIEAYKPVARPH